MSSSIFILSTLFFFLLTTTITAIPEPDYSSLVTALRNRNYNLFANAISTTDLSYDILTSHNNFTFFAPIDSVLYSLDMSMSAPDYTTTMRFHVVPDHRLTFFDLKTLPYGSNSFPTLLTGHDINILNPVSLPLPIIVEGVFIHVPDLYSDEHVVVHGLESVIDFRSRNYSSDDNNIVAPVHAPSPTVTAPVTGIDTVAAPVTGIDTVASPVPVPSYMPSPAVSPLPETKSESIIQSNKSPEKKSESVIESNQSPEIISETIVQSLESPKPEPKSVIQSSYLPKTRSETIINSNKSPQTRSESIVQSIQSPKSYYESITQPIEKHATISSRSRFIPQAIHHVSLATKSTGETVIDCPVSDDDDIEREEMSIANIRRGDRDHYMRELYNNPTEMSCAHE